MDHRTSTILDDLYLCRQVRFILIATIVSLPVASFGQEADIHPSLQAILEEHEKTVIAIQRLDLAANAFVSLYNNGKWDEAVRRVRYRWSMTPDCVRYRYWFEPDPSEPGGAPLNVGDRLETADEVRTILDWDSSHPTSLNPLNQGYATFSIEPRGTPRPFPQSFTDPPCFVMFAFRPNSLQRRMKLRELCDWGRRCELVEASSEPDNSQILRVWHPVGRETMESHTDLWLAADKGHLVHRVVQRSFVVGESAGREEEWNVVQWLTLNEGTSFPLEVERLIQRSDKTPIARHRWIVDEQQLVINRDISGDAFLFSFPKNAIVRRFPPVNGKIKAELWGDNDQPLRNINSLEDLLFVPNSDSRVRTIAMLTLTLLTPITIGCFYWFRRQRLTRERASIKA